MPTLLEHKTVVAALAVAFLVGSSAAAMGQAAGKDTAKTPESGRLGLGEKPSDELIRAWNIDIPPSGENLPEGRGSVAEGRKIYESTCVACHGETGTEGPMDRLVGGKGSLNTDKPVKTVGSYWPYATTLYDYIHRAMPFNNPQSLTPDQVYAVSAYILNMNGIIPDDAVLDKNSLPKVEMPNRGSFEQRDTVTLAKTEACMENCKPFAIEMKGKAPGTITEDQVQ